MSTPKVSFLIPAYNCESTISDTVHSALNQTEKNIEVVIVDDGSTDNTKKIIERIKDSRIIYIYKDNGGISSALNLGLQYCKSNLVARLDSDDIAHPKRIEIQLNEFKKNKKLVMLGTGIDYIDKNSFVIGKLFTIYFKSLERKFFLKDNVYQHPSVMFRKDAVIRVGLYQEKLSGLFEDYYLWGQLRKIGDCRILPYSLTKYRISDGQITNWKPSKEYHDLVANIVESGKISDYCLKQLVEIKERDKKNSSDMVQNRVEASKNNVFYKLFLFLKFFLNEELSYFIVCLIKNIILKIKMDIMKE